MTLRPYQVQCVDTLWNALAVERSVLCVMACGAGKTKCFVELIRRANVKTVVLVGRNKLVDQTVDQLRAVVDDVGVWSAAYGEKRIAPVTVVSIHSADKLTIPDLKFIVCDEAHCMNDGRYGRFLERHPNAKLVGFTATPWRDGVEIFGDHMPFKRIHYKRGIKQLIAEGFLVPPVVKATPNGFDTSALKLNSGDDFKLSDIIKLTDDSEKIRAQVADALPRLEGRKKVVWMCATIEHAERVAKAIGSTAALVHSENPHNQYALDTFEGGDVRHMVNVMMLTEGYDFPAIDAVVLMRPTRSPTLAIQTIGRSLRLAPEKKDALILDYGEVIKHCGPIHDPFTKAFRAKVDKERMVISTRVCPKCLSYIHEGTTCPDCNYSIAVERDPLKNLTREASLVDLLADRRPKILKCVAVSAAKYLSKSGNKCILISFSVEGRLMPIKSYISNHPYSWKMGQKLIQEMIPFTFESWQECYDNCEALTFDVPDSVIAKDDNGFEKVERILGRTSDSDIPF